MRLHAAVFRHSSFPDEYFRLPSFEHLMSWLSRITTNISHSSSKRYISSSSEASSIGEKKQHHGRDMRPSEESSSSLGGFETDLAGGELGFESHSCVVFGSSIPSLRIPFFRCK